MEKSRTDFRAMMAETFSDSMPFDDPTARLSSQARGVSRFSTYAGLLERFEQCARTAQRRHRLVLLLILEFPGADRAHVNRAGMLLAGCLRASDSLCVLSQARLAVLVAGLRNATDAPKVANKLYQALHHNAGYRNSESASHVSAGAGLFPLDGATCENVWRQANAALERARAVAPGNCCFSEIVTGRAVMERLELIKDSYEGFKNREFFIVYQPIFAMDSERVSGFEALLRWQHPQRGLLYPETFMELLEESGLIVPVGEWIVAEACRTAARLSAKSSWPTRVCVNVSGRQLADPGFLFAVLDGLYDAGIDAGLLQLELSEQTLADNRQAAEKSLRDLGKAGVLIAVDHFGAGKSTLIDLMQLPVALIKIDRSLVDSLAGDAVARTITSGTLATANAAGMNVGAVGIEDNAQMQLLESMGCAEVQGSLLARPQAAGDLLDWLPA